MRAPYETDWTRRWWRTRDRRAAGPTEEVARVIEACREHGVAVVPQGGNTGWSVPACRAAARSCSRSRGSTELGEVDAASMQVERRRRRDARRAAGSTRAAAGLDAGVDFAARDSATLGGLVACDAGGIRAVRHGTVRARVAGLEAVLADGRWCGA